MTTGKSTLRFFWRLSAVLVVGCLLAAPTSAAVVGYWTFDSDTAGAGNAVANLVDSTFNGTQFGNVVISNDVPTQLAGGKSLDMTSGNTYVRINSSSKTQTGNGNWDGRYDNQLNTSMAISAWVKGLPNGSWEPYVSKKGESSHGYQLRRHSGTNDIGTTIRGTSAGDDLQGGGTNVADGQWHHAVMNWDGSTRSLYFDGSLIRADADSGTMGSPTNEFLVFGARDNPAGTIGAYSNVQMDDVAIYNQAITRYQGKALSEGADPINLPAPLPAVTPGTHWEMTVIRDGANNLGAAIQDLEDWWAGNGATNVTQKNTEVVNHEDSGGGGGSVRRPPRELFPGDQPGGENNFAIGAKGLLEIVQEGDYTFMVFGDDGSRFRLTDTSGWTASGIGSTIGTDDGFQVTGCCNDGLGQVHLTPGKYPTELIWNEQGGGAYVEVWAARGSYTSFDSQAFFLLGEAGTDALNMVHIPEPATLLVWSLLGALGLGAWRRRRAY